MNAFSQSNANVCEILLSSYGRIYGKSVSVETTTCNVLLKLQRAAAVSRRFVPYMVISFHKKIFPLLFHTFPILCFIVFSLGLIFLLSSILFLLHPISVCGFLCSICNSVSTARSKYIS